MKRGGGRVDGGFGYLTRKTQEGGWGEKEVILGRRGDIRTNGFLMVALNVGRHKSMVESSMGAGGSLF